MKFKNFLYKNSFHKLKTLISLVIFCLKNKAKQNKPRGLLLLDSIQFLKLTLTESITTLSKWRQTDRNALKGESLIAHNLGIETEHFDLESKGLTSGNPSIFSFSILVILFGIKKKCKLWNNLSEPPLWYSVMFSFSGSKQKNLPLVVPLNTN